tara:strand:+ start:360 stop:575 length:216 start_codon:yes stop_codon:yes gene_type:complete
MPVLSPRHRELIAKAAKTNAEVNADDYGDGEYIAELEYWGLVDSGWILTKLGHDAAINIECGIVVEVRESP